MHRRMFAESPFLISLCTYRVYLPACACGYMSVPKYIHYEGFSLMPLVFRAFLF